jgi:hypothetical protein
MKVSTAVAYPPDLAAVFAHIGINPTLEDPALHDAILSAIAERRGYVTRDVDHAGWRVDLPAPEQQDVHGLRLAIALG